MEPQNGFGVLGCALGMRWSLSEVKSLYSEMRKHYHH